MCLFIGLLYDGGVWGGEWVKHNGGGSKVTWMWIQSEFQGWETWPKAVVSQMEWWSNIKRRNMVWHSESQVRQSNGQVGAHTPDTLGWLSKHCRKGAEHNVSKERVVVPFQSHPSSRNKEVLHTRLGCWSKSDQKADKLTRTGKLQKPLGHVWGPRVLAKTRSEAYF